MSSYVEAKFKCITNWMGVWAISVFNFLISRHFVNCRQNVQHVIVAPLFQGFFHYQSSFADCPGSGFSKLSRVDINSVK